MIHSAGLLFKLSLVTGALVLFFPSLSIADAPFRETDGEARRLAEKVLTVRPTSLLDTAPRLEAKDEALKQAASNLIKEIFNRETKNLAHAEKVLESSYVQSIIIFSLAHLLVILAVLASVFEFSASRKLRKKAHDIPGHDLEIGVEKLAIKTSSLGLLYLVAAFGFYFMYLKFVYPVTVVGQVPQERPSNSSPSTLG
jgi:hypothetical protein